MVARRSHTSVATLTVTLALALGTPATSAGAAPAEPSTATHPVTRTIAAKQLSRGKWEKRILKLTNKHRAKHDCKPLARNNKLRKAARKHSNKMAAADRLSHQLKGEASLGNRVTAAGYRNWRGLAENIAFGHSSPKRMVTAWMNSPGHRQNILNCSYRHLGVGVKLKGGTPWATQDFGHK